MFYAGALLNPSSSEPSLQIARHHGETQPGQDVRAIVLATVMFFPLRAICSISSTVVTLFRPWKRWSRYFYDLKVFTNAPCSCGQQGR